MALTEERRRQALKFGRRVKLLRNKSGLTQEKLAEKADVSAIYVRQIELGMSLPSIGIADSLRKALKATWDELMS